eukprot:SAG11_NODE_514_length_8830_cov_19.471484_2_plen_88_part_00
MAHSLASVVDRYEGCVWPEMRVSAERRYLKEQKVLDVGRVLWALLVELELPLRVRDCEIAAAGRTQKHKGDGTNSCSMVWLVVAREK